MINRVGYYPYYLSTLLLLIQFVCCSNDLFGIREHMHNGGTFSSVRVLNLPRSMPDVMMQPLAQCVGNLARGIKFTGLQMNDLRIDDTGAILIPIQRRWRYSRVRNGWKQASQSRGAWVLENFPGVDVCRARSGSGNSMGAEKKLCTLLHSIR
jgi:hypothetical protein